ncbi:glycosyltransferase [Vibrio sp.]|nr:glycosyltransferase [Vibrio sp.]
MKVLHIHQDYPDGRNRPFTKAVSNLIENSEMHHDDVQHEVLSINRCTNPLHISIKPFEQGVSVMYWSLPIPIVNLCMMVIWSFVFSLILKNKKYDLIHGHKLTTEGMITYFLSKHWKIPYFISVRGGSDEHNMKRWWDCKGLFKKVYLNAKHVFFVNPAIKASVEERINAQRESTPLPNIIKTKQPDGDIQPSFDAEGRYCFIMSFHQYKRKGLIQLIQAIAQLKASGTIIQLDIIGSGATETLLNLINDEINHCKLAEQIRIVGALPHDELLAYLPKSKGLLLPAVQETFGMVYIEALTNGIPILYMANTGVDGYLADGKLGYRLYSQDVGDIAKGVEFIDENQRELKSYISELKTTNFFEQFTGESVSQFYIGTVLKHRSGA